MVASYEDYCKQFAGVERETAVGEVSTHNLYSSQAPALIKIKRYIANARMIAILRNPVERAFSAFSHMVRDGREKTNDFRAALAREPARIRDNWEPFWHYKSMGFYGAQLSRYFEVFERKQIRVYIYDDFLAHPLKVIRDILAFIGVDPDFLPDMSEKVNVSIMPRSRQLQKMMTGMSVIRSRVQEGESPEVVARVFGIGRTAIYRWLADYRRGGWGALKAQPLWRRCSDPFRSPYGTYMGKPRRNAGRRNDGRPPRHKSDFSDHFARPHAVHDQGKRRRQR